MGAGWKRTAPVNQNDAVVADLPHRDAYVARPPPNPPR